MGGLCLPNSCDEKIVATWIAPHWAPYWKYPRQAPKTVNESHVRLPPARAMKRPYPHLSYASSWVAAPPAKDKTHKLPAHFEFIVSEHRYSWNLSDANRAVLLAVASPALLIGVLSIFGLRLGSLSSLSPSMCIQDLMKPRGPVNIDICRVALLMAVLVLHSANHDSWHPEMMGPIADWTWLVLSTFNRVNTSYAVLATYLCLRRGCTVNRARGLISWLCLCVCHIVRRWFFMCPLMIFWTYIYLYVYIDDVPLNHMNDSQGLFIWYGQMRSQCVQPWRLGLSFLFLHDPLFGERTPCHNVSIYEGIFQIDIVVFALATLFGRTAGGVCALLLWPLSVYNDCLTVRMEDRGIGHRFKNLVPPALITCFLTAFLSQGRLRRMLSSSGLAVLVVSGLLVTGVLDVMKWNLFPRPDSEGSCSSGGCYCPWGHVFELPHILAVFLFLRYWDAEEEKSQEHAGTGTDAGPGTGTSFACLIARISSGMNITNLFVIHYFCGYLHDEPMERSVVQLIGRIFTVFLFTAMLSLPVYICVEAPFAYLAPRYRVGQPLREESPVAAAANNGSSVQNADEAQQRSAKRRKDENHKSPSAATVKERKGR